MKRVLFATALALGIGMVATQAKADILRPPSYKTSNLTGAAAEKRYNAIPGPTIRGDSLRTESSSYKVARSPDGQKQTICERRTFRIPVGKPDTYRCTIQTSTNGRPVPEFHPSRRVG